MMEVEKRFSVMDLSSLKDAPVRLFVQKCIQYQEYKTKVALERIDYKSTGWSLNTATVMFDSIVSYLKYGKTSASVTNKIKAMIDEIISSNKYIPLTPSKNDRRKSKGHKNITVKVERKPISNEMKPSEVIQRFLYAVCSENLFYTFKTENEVNTFIQGVKFIDKNADVKVKKISILED